MCPNCGARLLVKEEKHLHCILCGRDYKLVPFRGESKRAEIVEASRGNDCSLASTFTGAKLPVFQD